jgi:cyclopropane-fatty-acyl-phospholipid synthase
MSGAAQRLEMCRRLLAHARERLGLSAGFVLWDGSTVPADLAADAFAVSIADEGVFAALLRKPNIDTLVNLWASARVDLRNGTIFDLAAQKPRVRTKDFMRSLDKGLVFRTLAKFLFVPRGGPWPLENIRQDKPSAHQFTEDKANIHFHYDASNAFYELFLDPEMVYTCAYFKDWNNDIATAQRDKLDLICQKLRLKPGETLLDLGCGWGSLVIHAAQHYGVKAYGVTLAEEQVAYAQEKIARLGLGDRAKVELKDYAQVEGTYDKVSCICMLEHVGADNFPTFYQTVARTLNPDGLFLNQSIARPAKKDDRTFRKKHNTYAALTRYVFPGAELDYIGRTATNLERYGFEVHDVEAWREHYQRTCKLWHDRLLANRAAAEREVGAVTYRVWLIYLAGCAIAFERNTALVFQALASKRRRGASGLPASRAWLYRSTR